MSDPYVPQKCPVCGGIYCQRYHDNPYGEVVCTKLKEALLSLSMMQMKIDALERDNFELKTRAQTPDDIRTLIRLTNGTAAAEQSGYQSSQLKKIIDNPSLRPETVYAVFQETISDVYPFLMWSFGEILVPSMPSNRVSYIKEHITDEEEEKLIAYADKHKYEHNMPGWLYGLFTLDRPKLSEAAEDILHDVIRERHKQPNSKVWLTSGAWSIHRILEMYKNANLGKAVLTIKQSFSQEQFNREIAELIKKYPEAEKYVALI